MTALSTCTVIRQNGFYVEKKEVRHLIVHEADAKQVEQVSMHAVDTHTAAAEHNNELLAVTPSHGDYTALGPLDSAQQLAGSGEYLEDGVRGLSP
jgi:hypothetical protein